MKFISGLFLIAVLAFGLQYVLPWWSIAVAAVLGGLIIPQKKTWWTFFCGFFAIGIFWAIYCFIQYQSNDGILANRMVQLIGRNNGILMIPIVALIGALIGGLSAMIGDLLHHTFFGKKKD